MPIICRLVRLSEADASTLLGHPDSLADRVGSATARSDVYRYWHAISYLLSQHRPGSAAAGWLTAGSQVSPDTDEHPAARLVAPDQVREIAADLRDVQPDHLAPHYDAAALDAAQVYPGTWQEWEEDFDPLGQVLEHYFFLQEFASQCAAAGSALLLNFEVLDEGTV